MVHLEPNEPIIRVDAAVFLVKASGLDLKMPQHQDSQMSKNVQRKKSMRLKQQESQMGKRKQLLVLIKILHVVN